MEGYQDYQEILQQLAVENSLELIEKAKTFCKHQGDTLLHYAVLMNDIDSANRLINLGFDVNAANNKGEIPLDYAVINDSVEMAEMLLKSGTSIEQSSFIANMGSPLAFAAAKGSIQMIKMLINDSIIKDNCYINAKNAKGHTPLTFAIFEERPEAVKLLIEAGCDLTVTNSHGYTFLIRAVINYEAGSSESYEIVKMLIEAGSNVNHRSNNNLTVLHYAAARDKDFMLIPLLLEKGADINATSSTEMLPLHAALESNNYNAVKGLIDAGNRLDWQDQYESNILHHAMLSHDPKIIQLLLEKGALVHAVNIADIDPFIFGIRFYRSSQNDNNDDIDTTTYLQGKRKCLKLLLKHGADINRVSSDGISALTTALRYVDVDSSIIPFLLNNKVIVDFSHETVYKAMNSSEKPEASRFLMKYVALCETLSHCNEQVRNFNLDQVQMELKVFYRACKDELEQMKKVNVDDEFSLYDVLARKSIACCVRNEKSAEIFERINLKDFPIYIEETRRRFEKETKKQKRLDEARNGLCRLLKWDLNSYAVVYDSILRFLPKNDLQTLSLI